MECCTNLVSHIAHKFITCKPRITIQLDLVRFIQLTRHFCTYYSAFGLFLGPFWIDINLRPVSIVLNGVVEALLLLDGFAFLVFEHGRLVLDLLEFFRLPSLDFVFICSDLGYFLPFDFFSLSHLLLFSLQPVYHFDVFEVLGQKLIFISPLLH